MQSSDLLLVERLKHYSFLHLRRTIAFSLDGKGYAGRIHQFLCDVAVMTTVTGSQASRKSWRSVRTDPVSESTNGTV